MGIIYKLTSPSGKSYIGQTHKSLEYRIQRHKSEKRKRPLMNAIAKYGFDSFVVEVLHECNNACLGMYEMLEIIRHNSVHPNGYNLSTGGEHSSYGYKHTDESKEKMREYHSNKTLTQEHKDNISKASKEMWQRPEYRAKVEGAGKGYKHTQEAKDRISKGNKGKKKPPHVGKAVAESNRRRAGEKRKRKRKVTSDLQLSLFD